MSPRSPFTSALALCLLILLVATSWPKLNAVEYEDLWEQQEEDNDPIEEEDAADTPGASRAAGGTAHDPFPFLNNFWQQKISPQTTTERDRQFDAKFSGMGIRLSNHTFIAPDRACDMAAEGLHYSAFDGLNPIQLRAPKTIDVRERPPGHTFGTPEMKLRCLELERFGDFGVYHYQSDTSNHLYEMEDKNPIHPHQLPQIQDDPKVMENCNLFAYSQPSRLQKHLPTNNRVFSKIPVYANGCQNGNCKFEVEAILDTGSCGFMSDAGAPIICGSGNKISHLVRPSNKRTTPYQCRSEFEAFHLAPHHKTISQVANVKLNDSMLIKLDNLYPRHNLLFLPKVPG